MVAGASGSWWFPMGGHLVAAQISFTLASGVRNPALEFPNAMSFSQLPVNRQDGSPWSRISIVTPSYNQAEFLEDCIRSVLDQNYPNLEYVIMDGGSTDGSVDIIKKYAHRLTYWTSERDEGQYDAINKGFSKTTGEIMAWLNSDDKYTPWAFRAVGELFAALESVEWITARYPITWPGSGGGVRCWFAPCYSRRGFYRGENCMVKNGLFRGYIQQESTFWRRSLWSRSGGRVDASLRLAADFDLWARFYQHAELHGAETCLGGFRMHGKQKTAHYLEDYMQETERVFIRHGGRPYGTYETFFRSMVFSRFPGRLRRWLGVLDSYRVCVPEIRSNGKWRIAVYEDF